MLPKKLRLSRKDFLVAKSHGQNHRFPHFSAIIYPNDLSYSRFAIVTSSKLAKRAVIRNRLRRHIYNQLKNVSGSCDVIIFPHPPMLKLTDEAICLALHPLLSKVSSLA